MEVSTKVLSILCQILVLLSKAQLLLCLEKIILVSFAVRRGYTSKQRDTFYSLVSGLLGDLPNFIYSFLHNFQKIHNLGFSNIVKIINNASLL